MDNFWDRKNKLFKNSENRKSLFDDNKKDLRLAYIIEESIVDGPGIRLVIFTQGLPTQMYWMP